MPARIEGQPHRRNDPQGYMAWWKAQPENAERLREQSNRRHSERVAVDPAYRQMKRDSARWSRRKAKYDLTREEYMAMREAQGGCCAICGKIPAEDLRVDHDHETKIVRALLCANCNAAIGLLAENVETLGNAIRYLTKHKRDEPLDLEH
jgi:hypothetical protein